MGSRFETRGHDATSPKFGARPPLPTRVVVTDLVELIRRWSTYFDGGWLRHGTAASHGYGTSHSTLRDIPRGCHALNTGLENIIWHIGEQCLE